MAGVIAPGARIVGRDAEWLVRKVNRAPDGSQVIHCLGISALVRDKETVFIDRIDRSLKVLDPAETRAVADRSSGFQASILFIESALRQVPPSDGKIHVGHRAAMDVLAFQLDPALNALSRPRQRILIADAVGLGKTLEAGILVSELIRRGRGRRILVVTLKSMLTQFQKEFWSRFTIPLVRLDSVGLLRLKAHIPTNHNPFHYYDKTIISIDTLKNDRSYRVLLEHAWWDIIVIDEAHNVAERGARLMRTGKDLRQSVSQRAKLAKLLAGRSDTLILLSATPHDGRPESFASLINMLDPTAIADPSGYGPDDIHDLFIRRFKKDIKDQIAGHFPERIVYQVSVEPSPTEEVAIDALAGLSFETAGGDRRTGGLLFKTTLIKAFLSSPVACLKTIDRRLTRLDDAGTAADRRALTVLREAMAAIAPADFAKYRRLVSLIRTTMGWTGGAPGGWTGGAPGGWTGGAPGDRLVIFTERLETLTFLATHLPADLGLPAGAVAILHGAMGDLDQQAVVEAFGQEDKPVRLLIASDVASEGINLHHQCHRMIHFDIPWSLMVFQQRNGRIDRYGQDRRPEIYYLMTVSTDRRIGDLRIQDVLIEKDGQAQDNIGDPSAFMNVHEVEAEERIVGRAMEEGLDAEAFSRLLDATAAGRGDRAFDPLAALLATADQPRGQRRQAGQATVEPLSLFPDDAAYLKAALALLATKGGEGGVPAEQPIHYRVDGRVIEMAPPDDLVARLEQLPKEMFDPKAPLRLSADVAVITDEIRRARQSETAWPEIQFLWPLHPVLDWVHDKVQALFRRHEAPILVLGDRLRTGETVFVVSGLIPNRRGHPLVHHWLGVSFEAGKFKRIEPFEELVARTGLGRRTVANPGTAVDTASLAPLLDDAVRRADEWMRAKRRAFAAATQAKLLEEKARLEGLKARHYAELVKAFENDNRPEKIRAHDRQTRERTIGRLFADFETWVKETLETEDAPFLQIIAVLKDRP